VLSCLQKEQDISPWMDCDIFRTVASAPFCATSKTFFLFFLLHHKFKDLGVRWETATPNRKRCTHFGENRVGNRPYKLWRSSGLQSPPTCWWKLRLQADEPAVSRVEKQPGQRCHIQVPVRLSCKNPGLHPQQSSQRFGRYVLLRCCKVDLVPVKFRLHGC